MANWSYILTNTVYYYVNNEISPCPDKAAIMTVPRMMQMTPATFIGPTRSFKKALLSYMPQI